MNLLSTINPRYRFGESGISSIFFCMQFSTISNTALEIKTLWRNVWTTGVEEGDPCVSLSFWKLNQNQDAFVLKSIFLHTYITIWLNISPGEHLLNSFISNLNPNQTECFFKTIFRAYMLFSQTWYLQFIFKAVWFTLTNNLKFNLSHNMIILLIKC